MSRNVLQQLENTIKRGCVVATYKTKPFARAGGPTAPGNERGGKQYVSVGPYVTATSRARSFAVIGNRFQDDYGTARVAAHRFIEHVGRDAAWNATVRARHKCGIADDGRRGIVRSR